MCRMMGKMSDRFAVIPWTSVPDSTLLHHEGSKFHVRRSAAWGWMDGLWVYASQSVSHRHQPMWPGDRVRELYAAELTGGRRADEPVKFRHPAVASCARARVWLFSFVVLLPPLSRRRLRTLPPSFCAGRASLIFAVAVVRQNPGERLLLPDGA